VSVRSSEELGRVLRRIDGKQYPAYRDLEGAFDFPTFRLFVDRTQSDAYAPPSRLRVRVPMSKAGFPKESYSPNLAIKLPAQPPAKRKSSDGSVAGQASARLPPSLYRVRATALADFLTRVFIHNQDEARRRGRQASGGGGWHGEKGGEISIDRPGQHVLERTSIVVNPEYVEARFTLSLPAQGRRILGTWAHELFTKAIPFIVERSLLMPAVDKEAMWRHIETTEDQEYLRECLSAAGLVAFVRDGAILPRASGVSDLPLRSTNDSKVVAFRSPENLRVKFPLVHHPPVTGMGIREGITMIVGGGFHGKSTLLKALEVGVYNHVPGDGREFVSTVNHAVKVRAEDGRCVSSVDISCFITNLPHNRPTNNFSTPDASGSTSQAANILEALEVGSKMLLLDEDTCATNFMIRDRRMRMLVADSKEPITPFISRIKALYTQHQVSCVLVIGGSGDYFEVADSVVQMDSYLPIDVTAKAKAIAEKTRITADEWVEREEKEKPLRIGQPRLPVSESLQRIGDKTKALSVEKAVVGSAELDLSAVEQLVEKSQTRCIADIIIALPKYLSNAKCLSHALDLLEKDLDNLSGSSSKPSGLDAVGKWIQGCYARPRRFEIAAALNRLREAQFKMVRQP